MEHLLALPGGEAGGDGLVAAEDLVEAAADAVDREIAGEHAAIRTEEIDDGEHDLAIPLDGPGQAGDADAGDLRRHIGRPGEAGHPGLPGVDAFAAAVGR